MGARSLAARVTFAVVVVSAPALVAVAGASIFFASRALDAADETATSARAVEAAVALRDELAEGTPMNLAVAEVIAGLERGGTRAMISYASASTSAPTSLPTSPPTTVTVHTKVRVPDAARLLPSGQCAQRIDATGVALDVCARQDGEWRLVVASSRGAHRGVVRALTRSMIVVVVASLVALGLTVTQSVRRATAGLRRLAGWADAVGVESRPTPAPREAIDELVRLAHAFDCLLERLFETLDRERTNAAYIAHEMRTPLAALRATLDSLAVGALDAEVHAHLRDDADRLARVIDAVLVLARPDGGKLRREVVNVADLVRELAPASAVVDAPDEALIDGDADLLRLALQNLIENAHKHAGRPPRSLRVSRDGDAVVVTVVDDGPGLSDDGRAAAFDRLWRGSDAPTGWGLGLALVRAVAERHGGSASAATPSVGGLAVSFSAHPLLLWVAADSADQVPDEARSVPS